MNEDKADLETSGIPVAMAMDDTKPISIDEPSPRTGDLPYLGWIPIGALIQNSYRILRQLGEGGMGIVLHGVDERLEREVAIKFIHPKHVDTEELHELFVREARAMARARHPNLVEIYARGEYQGSPYFVMEYIKGTTLEEWVAGHEQRPVALDDALSVLDQICRGVSALHAVGAVHRDLKPSNVMIGPGFRAVVTDMGLAINLGGWAAGREPVAGTPAYIAPEIAVERHVSPQYAHASDVYAIGVIAYELLTGRHPFESKRVADLLRAHIHETPRKPSEVAPGLPDVFDDVLMRALAKDPESRIASAHALRTALAVARDRLSESSAPTRIMIADDDHACLRWTAKFISGSFPNATLDLVSDGATALQHAMRDPPSVAILDLSMPGLNGTELTAALRANPQTRDVPIVVVTGVGGAPDWRLLLRLGASGFLVKPTDPDALVTTIRRLLV
ncbi:Serine/threonine protein kinase PrkC, regulator of stationary phase [Enhygromyxa salina]|uniref:Serine/threonine protein kinase PrkC, regulator of stationary phase n=1 Tax=Enhygromyxa salina TaxID=215803 RepID=A0A0C1Z7M2_9BACT|nr:protein kinase [Enhygromyxa salina]KIG13639.1 Serine/threonine protein kinase PrkC, regulator of stationary phase [Enhygromyxa salina]